MRTIIVSSTLFLTVVCSVCLGIFSAYIAIQGFFHIFTRQPSQVEEPAPALITQEATLQQ
ncbi:MAG TPA: hypothetical protein VES66_09980 [Terriglobales bacterium]|nr:hypothetical protein [Terriglobales bacterium]